MTIRHRHGSYDVDFVEVEILFEELRILSSVIITDSNVHELWLKDRVDPNAVIVVPAGEESKNVSTYESVTQQLANCRLPRSGSVIAFGGGVVGDLAGFVAATYMRGVNLIQVPSTVLAMVDSSVGGKVGIDLPQGKNLIGAFWPPKRVLVCHQLLSTLPARHMTNGLAEILKYGFIYDPQILTKASSSVEVIERCIQIKAEIVEQDEFETTGLRAILNFGHTIGHALEAYQKYQGLLHGEAISVGMCVEALIGEELGITPTGTVERLKDTLAVAGLPTSSPDLKFADEMLDHMRIDKKNTGSGIAMSLLTDWGACKLIKDVPERAIREALTKI